jgi:hypothetical protein
MKFTIPVDRAKKHRLSYQFNPFLGRMVIKADHKVLKSRFRLFNEPLAETERLCLGVGPGEVVKVRIEKERCALFRSKWLVYLNDRLFRCYEGV